MVIVVRDAFAAPLPLHPESRARREAERHLRQYLAEPVSVQRSTEYRPIDDLLAAEAVVEAARKTFHHRCAVCASGAAGELRATRWRPMLGAVGTDGRSSLQHYWWLAYDWSNIVLLCSSCERARGRRFPTENPRARVESTGDQLEPEAALLLDPTLIDYESSFLFSPDGLVTGTSIQSSTTVDVFALNRPSLVRDRQHQYAVAKELTSELARTIERGDRHSTMEVLRYGYAIDGEHYDVRRQVVHRAVMYRRRQITEVAQRSGIDLTTLTGDLPRVSLNMVESARRANDPHLLAIPVARRRPEPVTAVDTVADTSVPVAVTSLEVRSFRGIDHLDLEIPAREGGGDWLMLIGENGAGKTSVLQAIALALAGPAVRMQGANSGSALVKKGHDRSWIRAQGGSVDQQFTLKLARSGSPVYTAPHRVAVAAYGAMRLPRQGSAHRLPAQAAAVGTLFDPHGYVWGAGRWVHEIGPARRDAVAAAVSSALHAGAPDSVADVYFTRAGRLRLSTPAGTFAIEDLSSGQQVVASLVLDIARTFIASWESLNDAEGIVLIDEIEAHLHPRWQLNIVESLRQTFPRLQFICTTHSPLCLQGLRTGEIRVLRTAEGGRLWVDSTVPDAHGMTADQLLTSEIFGLSSTMEPTLNEQYREYYGLLSIRDRSEHQNERLAIVRQHLESRAQFGQTRREALMLRTIDDYIAHDLLATSEAESNALGEDVQAKLRSIWQGVIGAES